MTKLEIKHSYNSTPEKLFSIMTNAETAKHCIFNPTSGSIDKAEMTPKVGGGIVLIQEDDDQGTSYYGQFVEFDPPDKVSFVYAHQLGTDEANYVSIYFNETSKGCDVSIEQMIDSDDPEVKSKVRSIWSGVLERLERFVDAQESSGATTQETKDSQGQILTEGDSVKTIKDLKVKGSSMVIKRGTVVKKIRLIPGNEEEVDCKVNGVAISLETQWLIKVSN